MVAPLDRQFVARGPFLSLDQPTRSALTTDWLFPISGGSPFRRAGGGPGAGGEVPGSAGEVVGDRGAGEPGVVRAEPARGQVRQGPGDQIRVDLLDDRVAAVLRFGLGEYERRVGEHRVIPIRR